MKQAITILVLFGVLCVAGTQTLHHDKLDGFVADEHLDLGLLGLEDLADPSADKILGWDNGTSTTIWRSPGTGTGDLLADGTVPMTSNWDIGNYDLTLKSLTGDGTIEGATLTEGGNEVYSSAETPSGELGGTYASITVDATHSGSAHSAYEPALTDEASLYSTLSDVTQFWESGDSVTGAVGTDEAYASGWNADTGVAEKDDIYDYLHQIDADDDGSLVDENWYTTQSNTINFSGATLTMPKRTKNDDRFYCFNAWNPNALYDTDTQLCFEPNLPAAITITEVTITLDADPTTELDWDLKWADAFIGLSNEALIVAIDTTSGTTDVDSGFNDATVAEGKCLYIEMAADPDSNIKQAIIKIRYNFD